MIKTKIPWADYTINPVKGLCPMACPYCYARKMYKRFKWNPEIRLIPLFDFQVKEGSRIFVGSTIELFGEWIKSEWLAYIFKWVRAHPQHVFIFLTKCPQNLKQWSPFPDNCWIGMTVDTFARYGNITDTFSGIKASVKFVSFEPMLDYTPPDLLYVNWIIIGSQTQPVKHPPELWVRDLIKEAGKFSIPVFIKEPLSSHYNIHRWEFPRLG